MSMPFSDFLVSFFGVVFGVCCKWCSSKSVSMFWIELSCLRILPPFMGFSIFAVEESNLISQEQVTVAEGFQI